MLRRGMPPWEARSGQDGVTASIHAIWKRHPSARLCSLHSPLSMDWGVMYPPHPRTKRHRRRRRVPPGCSDTAAQGGSLAKREEVGGQGGAKRQEAQIDLFLPPLL